MAVVKKTVGPDEVEVVREGLLTAIHLGLDAFVEGREVHRPLDDCRALHQCLRSAGGIVGE